MKVYISVDIEGVTGLVSFSQCGRPDKAHYDYPFARKMLTHDVNAAIRGLRAAGATEVVVKDAHATCKNLLIDQLEPGTQLISGFGPAKDGMMDGIDDSFAAALLIGYHGMAGAQNALMDHALVGGLYRFWINEVPACEIAVSAAVAGAYGVPTILVTGDEATCAEAQSYALNAYATKTGFGKYMGQLLPPDITAPAIEQAAHQALLNAKGASPYEIKGPVTMRAEFRTTEEADLPAQTPNVQRLNATTLEWTHPTYLQAHQTALTLFHLSIQGRKSSA